MLPAPQTDRRDSMAFAELKAKQSVMWGNGPYERITNTLTDLHDLVIERVDPKPGERDDLVHRELGSHGATTLPGS